MLENKEARYLKKWFVIRNNYYLTKFFGTPHLEETVFTISSTSLGSRIFFAGLFINAGDCLPVKECVANTLKEKQIVRDSLLNTYLPCGM